MYWTNYMENNDREFQKTHLGWVATGLVDLGCSCVLRGVEGATSSGFLVPGASNSIKVIFKFQTSLKYVSIRGNLLLDATNVCKIDELVGLSLGIYNYNLFKKKFVKNYLMKQSSIWLWKKKIFFYHQNITLVICLGT